MKQKLLKVLLILPVVLFAQAAPPADEPTVPIDDYIFPVLSLIVLVSYLVLKLNTIKLKKN